MAAATGRFCRNIFLRLQQDCWRHALAVILLRRIGGTTEDLRDLRIAKTNIEGRMEPFLTSGCMRPRERCIQKRSHFSQKSKPYMNRSNPSLRLPSLSGAGACAVRNLKSIEDFRAKPIYGGDQTRVDLAYAVYALAHGVPENDGAQRARFA